MNTYLMLTTRTDQFKQKHVAGHYEFSDRLQAEKRLKLFGQFSDATGGAYVIEAGSLEEAEEIGHADPLVTSGSSMLTIKE
ncbi:YciI family protein [Bacillus spizizenii]|uniref:YciI family protein n=1 Tax=Bacillus spizizenii TaxID=96241 RepID=UPI0005CB5F38|nr:YciI family protein [Bacillus spizizenii]MCY8621696.1 YciI family protein [Bacillus spizizenii]MCY8630939.1 YciI family protein [Bacillus spizizenii]MCY8691211.1 YciI family protein [Bacillus spizizenii]MCY8784307.1 YciI family protein [Bacillus spizizenii]